MNSIIKTILLTRSKDQGIIIPTVIALGLVMTLLGTINVFKSNDENLAAISQRDTREALTAAEIGVAFYRDFIDKYKTIAVFNSTGSTSWTNRAGIPGIDNNNTCYFEFDGDSTTTTAEDEFDNIPLTGWQDINGSPGQYRLISYTYTSGNNTGTLIVEGRDNNNNEAGTARISVQYPIQPGLNVGDTGDRITNDLNNFDPVLWIGSDNITSIYHNNTTTTNDDQLEVNGNILVSKDDCQITDNGTIDIATNLGNVSVERRPLPATPLPPDDAVSGLPFYSIVNNISGLPIPITQRTSNTLINVVTDSSQIKNVDLPRNDDNYQIVNGKNVYHYLIENSLELVDGDEIRIQNGYFVVFYVQGRINIQGDAEINQNLNNTSENLQIYGNASDSSGNRFGCATGFTCPTDRIIFRGGTSKTINIKAFIHAPGAEVRVNSNPTVNIEGAMWVNQWNDRNNGSNKVTITPDVSLFRYASVRNPNGTSNLLIKPIIYPPSNWTTQRVP